VIGAMGDEPLPALLATAAAAGETAGGIGWSTLDVPLLLTLPVLLAGSGFFSGSETALFSLNESQRMAFRQSRSIAGRAVESLLGDQRMLLISLLLGNTSINVLYFVITSVLLMRTTAGPAVQAGLGVGFLLLIVLFGEVAPKVIASATRTRAAAFSAPLLLPIHQIILPVRVLLATFVFAPLDRLTAPQEAPSRLHDGELKALLEISSREGAIDAGERLMLRDIVDLGRLRVRDIMTPRVEMIALPTNATRAQVEETLREHRLTKIPIYEGDLDTIVGLLHVKRYLLDPDAASVTDPAVLTEAHFVPDLARLDQLLDRLRLWHEQSAIVVDEYGGTDGVVSLDDIINEMVGDLYTTERRPDQPPRLVGFGLWQVDGRYSAVDWAEAFDIVLEGPRVATVGGVIVDRLGRAPAVGDVVEFGHVRAEVESVEAGRVRFVLVSLLPRDEAEGGS
jgi:putative hemolysin